MLSRNEYRGKLSYEEYVKRYKRHEEAIFPNKKDTKPSEDIPPTQEEIKKYLEKSKQDLNDKTKELIKQQIEKKTGGKFKDLQDAINQLESEGGDTEEDKEHREHFMRGLQLARALQPNTENLTREERIRAKLVEASKKGYMVDDNFKTAQAYIDSNPEMEGYTIDPRLSNGEGIVVRTPNGETEIHYRSSQFTGKPSRSDISTNFRMITGFESEDPQFIQAKEQYQNAVNEYGSVEHFGGASKGGGKAIYMGQKYDIPSTTFNPLIGTKTARGITNTSQEHTIIRTTGDPTSLPLAVSSNANHENWNVKSLRPLKKNIGLNPIKNAYDAHRHDNFTEPRNVDNVSLSPTAIEELTFKYGKLLGQKGKYQTLNDMKTNYIEKGKSYSDFIFDLQNAGLRGDNDVGLVNGKPMIKGSGRHNRGSMDGTIDFWEAMGGKITAEEEQFVSGKKSTPQAKPKEKIDQMLEDTDDTADLIKQLNKQIQDIQQETGITDEELERDMVSEKEFQENISKLGSRKKGASPPKIIEDIEPELNKFINRQDLDIKPTPEEVRIRETQEDEFSKIEGDKKKSATTTDTDFESISEEPSVKLTPQQIKEFGSASPEERQNIINNHNEEIVNTTYEMGEAFAPSESAGFKEHFGEAINPVSMGAGMLVGLGVDKALDYLDPADDADGKPRKQAITGVKREALSGALTGGLMYGGTTALGGTSIGFLPEVVAGSAGYVAGAETGKLVSSGIKKLGGNQDEQDLGADTIGGLAGGAVGAGALIGGATLYGAELGSAGGLLGIGIGAGVGLLGGTLAFGVSEIVKHKNDIKKGFEDVGKGISNVAKSTGNFFKKLF